MSSTSEIERFQSELVERDLRTESTKHCGTKETANHLMQSRQKRWGRGVIKAIDKLIGIPEEPEARFDTKPGASDLTPTWTAEVPEIPLPEKAEEQHPASYRKSSLSIQVLPNVQHLHERRRKKKRNKMFLGANGPVYSICVFEEPMKKNTKLLWH